MVGSTVLTAAGVVLSSSADSAASVSTEEVSIASARAVTNATSVAVDGEGGEFDGEAGATAMQETVKDDVTVPTATPLAVPPSPPPPSPPAPPKAEAVPLWRKQVYPSTPSAYEALAAGKQVVLPPRPPPPPSLTGAPLWRSPLPPPPPPPAPPKAPAKPRTAPVAQSKGAATPAPSGLRGRLVELGPSPAVKKALLAAACGSLFVLSLGPSALQALAVANAAFKTSPVYPMLSPLGTAALAVYAKVVTALSPLGTAALAIYAKVVTSLSAGCVRLMATAASAASAVRVSCSAP